jgi:hypothetical protein
MARITINDMSPVQTLTPVELEQIFGAGRRTFRPTFEALENRELLASSLTASLNGNLLQLQDSKAGDAIHIRQLNGQISVDGISIATTSGFKPSIGIASVGRIEINTPAGHDQVWLGDVGHPLAVSAVLAEGNVDALYTPTDSRGVSLAANARTVVETPTGTLYALAGNTVLESATGTSWQAVTGLAPVSQLAIDPSGHVYAISSNMIYSISGTRATLLAGSVSRMLSLSSGAFVVFKSDASVWQTTNGNLSQLGTTAITAANGSVWFLGLGTVDAAGDHALYQVTNGQLNAASITSTAIGSKWLSLGGPNSNLGLPTGNVSVAVNGDRIQNFVHGSIYAPAKGAVQVWYIASGLGLTGNAQFTINANDIDQQQSGTCSFLSSLAAVAKADPNLLASHITQDDNDPHGYWDVKLFINGQWQNYHFYIGNTTNDDPSPQALPGQLNGNGSPTQNMWVVAFQRAYLQAENVPANMVEYAGSNYLAWRDPSVALQALTGNKVATMTNEPGTLFNLGMLQYMLGGDPQHPAITVACPASSNNIQVKGMLSNQESLVGSHEYTVMGVIGSGQNAVVELRNPWGFNPDNATATSTQDGGYVWVTWSQFTQDFTTIYSSNT